MEPREGAEALWSGCPMHYKHPPMTGTPHTVQGTQRAPHAPCDHPMDHGHPPAPHLHQTPRGSHALWTPLWGHLTSPAPPVPPSVAPPARGCGPSVGALWAAAPTWRVPAPASAWRSPAAALSWKQARCLCHLGKGNRATSAGTGNNRTGWGEMGSTHPSPPPHRGRAQPRPLFLQPKGFLGAQFAPAPINLSR